MLFTSICLLLGALPVFASENLYCEGKGASYTYTNRSGGIGLKPYSVTFVLNGNVLEHATYDPRQGSLFVYEFLGPKKVLTHEVNGATTKEIFSQALSVSEQTQTVFSGLVRCKSVTRLEP